ncbi:MAG: DMT family transporter [Thermoleophilia bacterium]|nr:DMT family transporter [Actinomycetota bacterium]MDH5224046.1 DMT family transporter [Actinomycetota bacterium]MDH5280009.1 DMT family transporter [Thermoleophilia bacterium]
MSRAPQPVADERSRRTVGVVLLSFTTVVWGLVPLVLKQVEMPTLAFASYRLWIGVMLYAAIFVATGRRLSWTALRVTALGGVFFAADIMLTFTAFRLTSVANATIIGALAPVFITLGAVRWFGERLVRRDAFVIASSFIGVALVAIGSQGSPSWSPVGDAAAALSVLTWSAYWLFSKRARETVDAVDYMAGVMLVSAIVVTALSVATRTSLRPPDASDWTWIVLIALVPGLMGHLSVAWSHRFVEAWLGSLLLQSQPVIGSVAAWVLLGERMTALTAIGGAVVVVATAFIVVRAAQRDPDYPEPETLSPAG